MERMKKNKQIAVIILNYFGFKDTLKCIDSVQRTLRSTVFLVDNSADDGEKTKLSNQFNDHKHIHLFFPSENLGFAAGVNLAIKAAISKGYKLFLLLNNDAILLNGAGAYLRQAFNQWPSVISMITLNSEI